MTSAPEAFTETGIPALIPAVLYRFGAFLQGTSFPLLTLQIAICSTSSRVIPSLVRS